MRADLSTGGVRRRTGLLLVFPDAKAIHTERPEDDCWASYSRTIGKFFVHYESLPVPPPMTELFGTMEILLVNGLFGGLDRESSIAAYRRNNEKVRATAADRLLVFTPTDGWDPLCRFLEVPTPATAFPGSNARDEFWALFGGEPTDAERKGRQNILPIGRTRKIHLRRVTLEHLPTVMKIRIIATFTNQALPSVGKRVEPIVRLAMLDIRIERPDYSRQ